MTAPCKDCPDRYVGCHAECEKYQRYNAEREAERQLRADKRRAEDTIRVGLIKNLKKRERRLAKK